MNGGELWVIVVGVLAGAVSGVIGTGSSLILLPLLAAVYGPQEAIIVMSVAALMGNLARVMAWWREIRWKPCLLYAFTGVPAAICGAYTMLALPAHLVSIALGFFFLLMLPLQRAIRFSGWRTPLWGMMLAGGVVGFLTGMLLSTGPLSVPVFLGYGLVKGGFIATEGMASLLLYGGKLGVFHSMKALPSEVLIQGLLTGGAVMGGTFLSKRLLLRMPEKTFHLLADGLLLLTGLFFVIRGGAGFFLG